MADTKISALAALTGANLAAGDKFVVVDTSDTSMGAGGTDKGITAAEVGQGLYLLRDGTVASRHLPSGALAATDDRGVPGTSSQAPLVSGTLIMAGIDLIAGQVITSITFKSGSTALSGGTHQWFGIADANRVVQRWTNDDTNAAWATTAQKTLNLTSTYTVPTSGSYYLTIMVAATTVPALLAFSTINANVSNVAPVLCGATSDTGLTTPPTLPFTAGAITAATALAWGWVS